jgi:hypothetical protein
MIGSWDEPHFINEGAMIVPFISSSQWTSSTGACAMVGIIEDQKKYFIAQNLEPLKIDSARGNGEYLNAYLNLSGCSQNQMPHVQKMIQNNFTNIYGTDLANSPEKSYERIEAILIGACSV